MKIAYLGAGCWGYCLAVLLAKKGHKVTSWTSNSALALQLNEGKEHPTLPGAMPPPGLIFTTDMAEALSGAELIVESVTSAGLRPVGNMLKNQIKELFCPFVITSKGIEQGTGLILPEVMLSLFGEKAKNKISLLSGPGFASEIILGLPTSVVAAAWDSDVLQLVCQAFTTANFRVYPNSDIKGVAFGALKNIIAIACGVSDGLNLGQGAKAALMTRGLHEMRKLATACGCKAETLNGLSGMGDLCLTCSSTMSRNTRFGNLIANGMTRVEALEAIGMVVEGAYTCVSVRELSAAKKIAMPITNIVYKMLYENLSPVEAVSILMNREIKQEHL